MFVLALGNYIGVIVAAIAAMIVGFVWYHPSVFGKRWMKLEGFSQKDSAKMKKEMMGMMVWMFIAAIVSSAVMWMFFVNLGLSVGGSIMQAITIAAAAWIFVATSSLGMNLAGGKPLELWLIQVAHLFVGFVVTGIVLVLI